MMTTLCKIRLKNLFRYVSLDAQKQAIKLAFAIAAGNNLKGDYYEFGVYKGDSLLTAYFFGNKKDKNMKFKGFDCFAGLPESDGVFKKGQYSASKEQVIKNIRRNVGKKESKRFKLIEGYFDSSLNKSTLDTKAKVIMIDSDIYSSAKVVLGRIRPILQENTVMIFDDWYANISRGEMLACKEWLEENKDIQLIEVSTYYPAGKIFIVKFKQ